MINLSQDNKKEILLLLFNGKNHRPYLTALKSKIYSDFYSDFISSINISGDNLTFEKIFIDNEEEIEKKLWFSGLNKKTVGDTYGSQSQDTLIKAINEIIPTITKIIENTETDLNEIVFRFNGLEGENEVNLKGADLFKILLAVCTRHAALKGGFASSFGKQIEKSLMIMLCKIFNVSENSYHSYDIRDEGNFTRETDFYLIKSQKKFKCEVKMMGRGNPEGADSLYARGTKVFIGDTLSETNKRQCEANSVEWLELRENGWLKFGQILDRFKIKYSLNENYQKELLSIIEKVI